MTLVIHGIDVGLFLYFKSLWGHWPGFDNAVEVLRGNSLLKAGPILATVWYLWFVPDARTAQRREGIVALLAAGCCAALLSVGLTKILPFRPRPILEPTLGSTLTMSDWARASSLPSDHASLFVAMAIGLIFVSRTWGVLALLDVLLFICFPRAYLGYHYLTDLVAGALIGAGFALLFNSAYMRSRLWSRVVAFERVRAPVFYGCLFLLTMEIADLFHSARKVFALVTHVGF